MPWFFVRAVLVGSPEAVMRAAVPDLQKELEARSSLGEPRVTWDDDRRRVAVEVDNEAATAEQAWGGVYDEIFEAACAVVGDFERLRVEILSVTPRPAPEGGRAPG